MAPIHSQIMLGLIAPSRLEHVLGAALFLGVIFGPPILFAWQRAGWKISLRVLFIVVAVSAAVLAYLMPEHEFVIRDPLYPLNILGILAAEWGGPLIILFSISLILSASWNAMLTLPRSRLARPVSKKAKSRKV